LAVATPTVFFHFYSMYMSGEIQKLRSTEEQLRHMEEGDGDTTTVGVRWKRLQNSPYKLQSNYRIMKPN